MYNAIAKLPVLDIVHHKRHAEGRAEEKLENARRMKSKGYPLDDIVDITGLTIEEINAL